MTATAATSGEAEGSGFWVWVQGGLDAVGYIPGFGEPADGANAVISAFRGDWTGAALSTVSMIPVSGDAVGKGGKVARSVAKYGDEAVAAARGVDKASDTARVARVATGQLHQVISPKVYKGLEEHRTLRGLYGLRDPGLVARAANKAAHYGYQKWHRELDYEIVRWLRAKENDYATKEQFENFLLSIYDRPEMRERFPKGLPI